MIIDERSSEEKATDKSAEKLAKNQFTFFFEGGIGSYVKHINKNKEPKHENIFYVEKQVESVLVEIALQ